jgi:membrane-bound lytic murein transglycosylase B
MTEAQYQQYLKEKQNLEKIAAEIRSRIIQLTLPGLDVPKDRKELAALASWAGQNAGGVRPALILGLIEVESSLGTNVGQCNCYGLPVCRHPELTYKQVMSQKHWPAFEAIVTELGLNIKATPVSCYVNGGYVQMGGAMGPAQFMPNTWLNLGYKQKVENITGQKPANPWLARDAFLAAALYLADWGAQDQSRSSEMGAVTAYLCGTSAMTTSCRRAGGEWYTNLVMQKADQWQSWINQGL